MTDYANVSARAMLVTLHISLWSARKFDKKATAQVNARNSAAQDAGRYNKHLFAGDATHAAALIAAGCAREAHYRQTLPWADEGWRLLPTANYIAYADVMRKERQRFDAAVETFIREYPTLQEQAKAKLGDLYRADDFPPVSVARARFGWSIEFGPVPSGNDIRVELPADDADRIRAAVTERAERATREAMGDAWARLHEAVSRIHRATGDDGIVRANLMDHAREVVDVLARLNVGGDAELEQMRRRVERELVAAVPDVDALRKGKDDGARASTQRTAADIMAAMAAHYAPPAKEVA